MRPTGRYEGRDNDHKPQIRKTTIMNRIPILEADQAPEAIAALYGAVRQKLGLVPNMVKALGHSAAGLQGYLSFSGAVSDGTLRPAVREKIALLVAEQNRCDYCLSAHTAIGGLLKLSVGEIEAARRGESTDPKEQTILDLAQDILDTQGAISDQTYTDAVAAGVTPEEAVEVVANVAVNLFTNYFNRFAQTEIDFPKVESFAAEPVAAG